MEGLRLLCGDLVVRVELRDAAVQIRLRGAGPFPADGGISVNFPFGLRMPHPIRVLADFWIAAGRPGPPTGRARRAGKSGSSG